VPADEGPPAPNVFFRLVEDALPIRMGFLARAAGTEPFDVNLDTYDYKGTKIAMAGLFKCAALLMATWGAPYLRLRVSRTLADDGAPLAVPPAYHVSS